jgi:serine/threonine protein kinase
MSNEQVPLSQEVFGPYVVYERLGVGGMATVHRALEQGAEGFERTVALKRLLPHLAEDASFIKSFVREAKLASLLSHVNIVQIYELGRVGTEYFISMEYIDGRDVRRILRHARKVTGAPPIHITVGLMLQLCDALDYAHNRVDEEGHPLGLVHRDISPSNLIVTSGGHLKIIDFGIAKAQSSQLRTQTGRVKGKLAYMAPEAISGSRDLDARSDIWATGVILHELLTARPLFASKNEYQTLLKVQKGDILPPSTFNQACPPELDAIVFRALARDPNERFANASELREELLEVKKKYALHTGVRDVAAWIEWAFGLEPPPGFTGDTTGVRSAETQRSMPVAHSMTPRPPQNPEDEEAAEVVWGPGAKESEDHGPVVLEDVPDVSEKHQRPKRDTDDDMPTPPPRAGTMPSIYGSDEPVLAVGTEPPVARGSDQHRAQTGSGAVPLPAKRPTVPMPAGSRAKTASVPIVPRPTPTRTTAQIPTPPARAQRTTVDTPNVDQRLAAVRQFDGDSQATNPVARPLSAEDLFGIEADAALRSVSSQIEAAATQSTMPAHRYREESIPPPPAAITHATPAEIPSAPVVRFSKSMSVPIVNTTETQVDTPRARARTSGMMGAQTAPATKPGIGPLSASHRVQPRASTSPANVTSTPIVGSRIVAPKRTWLFVLGGILLAGGTAAVVAMALTNGKASNQAAAAKPDVVEPAAPVTPVKSVGTVKFVTEPADAEIKIGDKLAHAGSPFSSTLEAGIHQIEIHRAGYKSWLTSIELSANEVQTVRVVLEPLKNTTVEEDATLAVTTTPPGLEVLIDGTPFAEKTPIKTTLKVGPHSIVVRKDGLDVWRQNVNAEASSEYEYNPSFERVPAVAPRPATPAPKPAAPKPEPASPPTGSADVKPATESVTKSLIPAVVSGQPKAEPVGSAAVGTDGEALAKPAP